MFLEPTAASRSVPSSFKTFNPDEGDEPFVPDAQKSNGAFFTPKSVARSLVAWAIRSPADRVIEPACGTGAFLTEHQNAVGVEKDARSAAEARRRVRNADVREAEFFEWAARTSERFDAAVGNPPFIRFQEFSGDVRQTALAYCAKQGVNFSGLAGSWAPFLVTAASLLKPLGRIAFVVPAEIGHAPSAAPLIEYLVGNFQTVHVVAVREKLFPDLSVDCWLLYAEGRGGRTDHICFTALDRFEASPAPPHPDVRIPTEEWREQWNRRLRPFLLPASVRRLYSTLCHQPDSRRLSEIAAVGIGYITGANDFFHLRPSMAERFDLPSAFLQPTVRNTRVLPSRQLTTATLYEWHRRDDPYLLLRLPKTGELPGSVKRYLATDEADMARAAYKCRMRKPWYAVPDVRVPELFLACMSGRRVELVGNAAGASCTNTLHGVRLIDQNSLGRLIAAQRSALFQLSCEIEGHSLGGGVLKLEPGEASRILLPSLPALRSLDLDAVFDGLSILQRWRHYDGAIEIEQFDRTPALPVGFEVPGLRADLPSRRRPVRQIVPLAAGADRPAAQPSPVRASWQGFR